MSSPPSPIPPPSIPSSGLPRAAMPSPAQPAEEEARASTKYVLTTQAVPASSIGMAGRLLPPPSIPFFGLPRAAMPSPARPAEEKARASIKCVLTTQAVPASSIGMACRLSRPLRQDRSIYLNTNAGTISPFEHGEAFVLDDDGEVDLDLENYERFLDVKMMRGSNITTEKIYQSVIAKERRGDYLGKTVKVVPHVTDEIKRCIQSVMSSVPVDGQTCPADVCVIELGGTVGKDKTMASPEDHLTPMAVFWDTENCNVPKNAQVEGISDNIRNALSMEPSIDLAKVTIRTYGFVPPLIREGLQRTGVIHVDTLNRKKNAADNMILNAMYCFALDNPPPAGILLISGDADFAPTVRELVNRGYTIVIALPSTASSDLITAGTYAWDWPSLARGEGIVIRESTTKELGILKTEMIRLFKLHNGYMDVRHILSEYTKMFAQQIKLSDYHVSKLVDLFMKMDKPFYVCGTKHVFLDMEFAQGSTSAMTVGPFGVPASVTEIPVSMNMQFDQGSTIGPSGVPASITETSFVNMEEYPYGPAEDANVETEMVNEANERRILGKNLYKELEKRFKD